MFRFRFRLGLIAVLTLGSVASAGNAETVGVPPAAFAPGQEWSIKSVSHTTAKVIVGRLETWRGKICVNVSIVDVPIPSGMPGAGGVTEIAHIPFDQAALAASVDQLLATRVSPSPSFEVGYKQWQDAKGGVFSISVEKAIEVTLQMVNRREG